MRGGKKADPNIADLDNVTLLNQLASEEKATNVSINKAHEILKAAPNWAQLEAKRAIHEGHGALLSELHSERVQDLWKIAGEQGTILREKPEVVKAMFRILTGRPEKDHAQYVLTVFYEAIRNDCSLFDTVRDAVEDQDVFETFMKLTENSDTYIVDKSGYLLSGMVCRAPVGMFDSNQVHRMVDKCLASKSSYTDVGRLDVLCNLCKSADLRDIVWGQPGLVKFLLANLESKRAVPYVYRAAFAVWCLSFSETFIEKLVESGLVTAVCSLLNESKTEKVVRVCIHTLKNALHNDDAVELIIEANSVNTLTLLEYEKWKDTEMYDEIREGLQVLHSKIAQLSNFSRYKMELEKGKLKWSFLHSEKFWHENVMQFEDNEFEAVRKLASLLQSQDEDTICVACHDLGEFARLHPAGKKICEKYQVKQKIMVLMQSSKREIGREALLACQKLMLQRWQEVQKPIATPQMA